MGVTSTETAKHRTPYWFTWFVIVATWAACEYVLGKGSFERWFYSSLDYGFGLVVAHLINEGYLHG
jgi:hypothetical protein